MELYEKYKEIFWYLVVGGLTTVVSIGTRILFEETCNFPAFVDTGLSIICAILFAYLPNKLIVFKKHTKNILLEFISFVGSRSFAAIVDILFMYITVDIFAKNFYIMTAISSIFVLVFNYIFSKFITFRKKKDEPKETVATEKNPEEVAEITAEKEEKPQ